MQLYLSLISTLDRLKYQFLLTAVYLPEKNLRRQIGGCMSRRNDSGELPTGII